MPAPKSHIRRVLAQVDDTPVSDEQIYQICRGGAYGLTRTEVHDALSAAQGRNLIRWIAYRGWVKGGRPHIPVQELD